MAVKGLPPAHQLAEALTWAMVATISALSQRTGAIFSIVLGLLPRRGTRLPRSGLVQHGLSEPKSAWTSVAFSASTPDWRRDAALRCGALAAAARWSAPAMPPAATATYRRVSDPFDAASCRGLRESGRVALIPSATESLVTMRTRQAAFRAISSRARCGNISRGASAAPGCRLLIAGDDMAVGVHAGVGEHDRVGHVDDPSSP